MNCFAEDEIPEDVEDVEVDNLDVKYGEPFVADGQLEIHGQFQGKLDKPIENVHENTQKYT
ncbi:MAG: hypothetical protein MJK04_07720 [Psychrosphaera sp.]|nr:hypothetical protein [Psychrosphaera sp.]